MTNEEIEQERVKFEASYPKVDLSRRQDGSYASIAVVLRFDGWLAAKEDAKREIDRLGVMEWSCGQKNCTVLFKRKWPKGVES